MSHSLNLTGPSGTFTLHLWAFAERLSSKLNVALRWYLRRRSALLESVGASTDPSLTTARACDPFESPLAQRKNEQKSLKLSFDLAKMRSLLVTFSKCVCSVSGVPVTGGEATLDTRGTSSSARSI